VAGSTRQDFDGLWSLYLALEIGVAVLITVIDASRAPADQ
jgi:hypothetical protein